MTLIWLTCIGYWKRCKKFLTGVVAHLFCRTGHSISPRMVASEIFTKSHAQSVLLALVAGLFFGLVAILLIQMLNLGETLRCKTKLSPELSGLLGGVLLIGIFSISP